MTRTIETISLITVMITVLFMNQHLALSESNNDKDYLMNSTAIRQLNSPVYMFEFEGEKYVFTSGWYLNHYGSHYINCLTLLENGENVYVEVLEKICRALNCSFDDIVELVPEKD